MVAELGAAALLAAINVSGGAYPPPPVAGSASAVYEDGSYIGSARLVGGHGKVPARLLAKTAYGTKRFRAWRCRSIPDTLTRCRTQWGTVGPNQNYVTVNMVTRKRGGKVTIVVRGFVRA